MAVNYAARSVTIIDQRFAVAVRNAGPGEVVEVPNDAIKEISVGVATVSTEDLRQRATSARGTA